MENGGNDGEFFDVDLTELWRIIKKSLIPDRRNMNYSSIPA